MTRAFALVTAIPPTIGHLRLIGFAAELADDVCVIVGTQPGEPYPFERADAIRRATASMPGVRVKHLHETLPQRPEDAPDFWPMWRRLLRGYGMHDGDLIVASERYGLPLAETSGGVFVPYDLERSTTPVRATDIRADPIAHFAEILPEFQPVLRKRITVMGAESTGKTTLSRALAEALPGHWLPEWARPYLEALPSPEVTPERMHVIWQAQRALQRHGQTLPDKPFIVQDTDLFATVGFWETWSPSTVPQALIDDALPTAPTSTSSPRATSHSSPTRSATAAPSAKPRISSGRTWPGDTVCLTTSWRHQRCTFGSPTPRPWPETRSWTIR